MSAPEDLVVANTHLGAETRRAVQGQRWQASRVHVAPAALPPAYNAMLVCITLHTWFEKGSVKLCVACIASRRK